VVGVRHFPSKTAQMSQGKGKISDARLTRAVCEQSEPLPTVGKPQGGDSTKTGLLLVLQDTADLFRIDKRNLAHDRIFICRRRLEVQSLY
jgi:hypothetical protein